MAKNKSSRNSKKTISVWDALGFNNIFQNERLQIIVGVILICVALFMLISFVSYFFTGAADQSIIDNPHPEDFENKTHEYSNTCKSLGADIAEFLIGKQFGIGAFCIPIFIILLAVRIMRVYMVKVLKWFFGLMILMIWSSVVLAQYISPFFSNCHFNLGGNHGRDLAEYISNIIGTPGLTMVIIIIALTFLIYLSNETIYVIRKSLRPIDNFRRKIQMQIVNPINNEDTADEDKGLVFDNPSTETIDWGTVKENEGSETSSKNFSNAVYQTTETGNDGTDLQIDIPKDEEVATGQSVANVGGKPTGPYDPKKDLSMYNYPTLNLLQKYDSDGQSYVDKDEQENNKNRIITVLGQFGVEISSITATIGPTITLYEITPAPGIRISKIRNLEDDIALSLAAKGIRIIAPIPGKGTIGIEVPNAKPRIVSMESILNSRKFQETTMDLPIALGKTITNEVFMVDLAKIPHLLVAGATGQGKSVGLNAIIGSLLYKKHPAELKLVLVDPKKVEFSIYSSLERHFLASIPGNEDEPIITDVHKVVDTLNSLCKEMDDRYDLLKRVKARNIKEYNAKFQKRELNPMQGHRYLPYIVVIIDEFGDLILTAGREIEMPITRIAQLARAVGIHMVIATQRPTTSIITGNIKANFPGRMAFKVSAVIDSRIILDRPGANQLIGRGDMLFLNGNEPVRVQCAFLDTPEVERVNNFIASQQGYGGPFELPEPDSPSEDGNGDKSDMGPVDPLFEDAARLIMNSQMGSTSNIQRQFAIGYNRAGRLMDQMERAGIVGPARGSKPREVYIQDETSLQAILNKIR